MTSQYRLHTCMTQHMFLEETITLSPSLDTSCLSVSAENPTHCVHLLCCAYLSKFRLSSALFLPSFLPTFERKPGYVCYEAGAGEDDQLLWSDGDMVTLGSFKFFHCARTDPESDLYAWKMTPRVLTSKSDHTRSGLHEKYHIRFLDTCRLYNIYSKLWNLL